MEERICKAVKEFMDMDDIAYAIPGTPNHTANFYGNTEICPLDFNDVLRIIEVAAHDWTWPNEADPVESAIAIVLPDLQLEKPE